MADQGGASSWCGSQSRACGIQERASNIGGELRNAPEARFVSRLPSLASVALTESVLHAQPLPARSSWDARLIRPHKIGRSVDHTAVRASKRGNHCIQSGWISPSRRPLLTCAGENLWVSMCPSTPPHSLLWLYEKWLLRNQSWVVLGNGPFLASPVQHDERLSIPHHAITHNDICH